MAKPSERAIASGSWADRYRNKWKWDKVTWGSHSVDCYPGGCPFRVYVRDGKIIREEQGGKLPVIQQGVPDMNPMGCQKGASWCHIHYSKDRILHPLKRAGERGEGKWEQVSWDQAFTEIADAMLDAVQDQGPESIINLMTPEPGAAPARMFSNALGTPTTDGNSEFQDFSPGYYITWGKFNPVSSMDDWFLAELTLIWHANPVYTNIHWYHYVAESRYNGGEVVTVAPDYSPSAIHADYHVPVKIGSDAAFALSMCKVIVDAELYDRRFVQEQTDLPLLIRKDNLRFLRGSDVTEGDRDDQFFWLDNRAKVLAPAPRGTLAMADIEPALEGTLMVTLKDGSQVECVPAFERLKERLKDYEPEAAAKICEIHPDAIRKLARKVATRRTKIFIGWNSGKYYHGDLYERAMALLLGLTGNWGKKGTGTRSWAISGLDGGSFMRQKGRLGQDAAREWLTNLAKARRMLTADDPTLTLEMVTYRAAQMAAELGGLGRMIPPAFLWYYQYGYKERWNNPDNNDPSMKRSFDEYLTEAIDRGWWDSGLAKTYSEVTPRVLFESGGNMLRRQRGGQKLLLEKLWPDLKMIVSVDFRMNTTGMYSDFILPAAQHYEKIGNSMPSVHHLNFVLIDKAVDPPPDVLNDYDIGIGLVRKIEERAAAREMLQFTDRNGVVHDLRDITNKMTMDGALLDEEFRVDETLKDDAAYGILPPDSSLEVARQKGTIRWTGWGLVGHGLGQASTIKPDEVHNPFRWHTEDKMPYPTLTRRAQFYIDHEWFLEAGEELPVHKEPPGHGGPARKFKMTSGHNRWSIHSMNMTNNILLNTHRGEPFMFINDRDAKAKGIENGEWVRVVSDVGSMQITAKLSPSVRPGQVIVYNGFEPYMHREWYSQADVEPGHVKWLGLVGGYGHLQYRPLQWPPGPAARAVHVDVYKNI